jgi:hypothetical protein
MANEIAITTRLSWSKGGAQIIASAQSTVDQAGENAIENVQIIGTSSEAVEFGDVTTVGHVMFKNQNATGGASVYIGTTSPVTAENAEITLAPGRSVYLATSQASWYALSSEGSSYLLVVAIEA